MKKKSILSSKLSNLAWELWCLVSVIGIWPRHIEPNLLFVRKQKLAFPNLPQAFSGLKILHLSDLHFDQEKPSPFFEKIAEKARKLKPDLILFTGDFISYGKVISEEGLCQFLKSFHAPMGCFACLGNHDYETYVTIDASGSLVPTKNHESPLNKGLKKLFSFSTPFKPETRKQNSSIPPSSALTACLQKAGITLLENATFTVKKGDDTLTLGGVGDRFLGRDQTDLPLSSNNFNLVMAHNPDSAYELLGNGADITFSGHTHGGQVNLPFIREKFLKQEIPHWHKGVRKRGSSVALISAGVNSPMTFRFLCPPEITLLELTKEAT